MGSVANKQTLGKVCDSLFYLSETVFNSNIIEMTITRKDITSVSDFANKNLVKILSEQKKDKIISTNN